MVVQYLKEKHFFELILLRDNLDWSMLTRHCVCISFSTVQLSKIKKLWVRIPQCDVLLFYFYHLSNFHVLDYILFRGAT